MSEVQLLLVALGAVVAIVVPVIVFTRCYGRTEESVKQLRAALYDNNGDNKIDSLRHGVYGIEVRLNNGYFDKVDQLCGDMDVLQQEMETVKYRVGVLERQ